MNILLFVVAVAMHGAKSIKILYVQVFFSVSCSVGCKQQSNHPVVKAVVVGADKTGPTQYSTCGAGCYSLCICVVCRREIGQCLPKNLSHFHRQA